MLRDVGAIDMIKAPMPVLDEFLNTIPDHYFNNPYHNVRHGVGVMQGVFCIIRSMGGDKYLTPHDQIWALLGALGHDIGHPGVSNNFLINTNNTIAQLYNSVSVLENFHAAETIRLLTRTETNIFQNLSKSKQAQAKHFIREVILATDMARHFHFIGQFKQKMGGTPRRNREKIPVKDRVMFAQMVLKTADIGNAGKTWDESIVWNTLIAEEFYRQGDKEVQLGFTPEPLYTRGAMSSTASSMFFMNNLAKPLFRTIESVLPQTKQLLDRLNTNYTQLSQKLADEKSGAGEAAAEGDAAEGENGAVTVTRVRVNKRKTIVFGAQTTNLLGQTAAPPLNAPTTTTE
jgi:hypothetical protein